MLTIKGVGIISAAGFVAEVGDIKRFTHPSQIQKLARILFAIMNKQVEYNSQKLIKRNLLK